jgi:hypothetical protein
VSGCFCAKSMNIAGLKSAVTLSNTNSERRVFEKQG